MPSTAILEVLQQSKKHELATKLQSYSLNYCEVQDFLANTDRSPYERALLVANSWYLFSKRVPMLLLYGALNVETLDERSRLICIANDELGSGKPNLAHSNLFFEALVSSGFAREDIAASPVSDVIEKMLDDLVSKISSSSCSCYSLGMLCGLEMPAEEIVELLIRALSHSADVENVLDSSAFFKIHRRIEEEHKEHFAEHYSLFCASTPDSQKSFAEGVQCVLDFWLDYWSTIRSYLAAGIVSSH